MPIYEPGLDELVAANTAARRLSFTTELLPAIEGADAVFIAVGTPSRCGDEHVDLSYVFAAARCSDSSDSNERHRFPYQFEHELTSKSSATKPPVGRLAGPQLR